MNARSLKLMILTYLAAFAVVACGKSGGFTTGATSGSKGGNSTAPSLQYSSMQVSSSNVADGITPAIVTIQLKNSSGTPLQGIIPVLSVSGSYNVIMPCSVTGVLGSSQCKVMTTDAGTKTITMNWVIQLSVSTIFQAPAQPSPFGIVAAGGVFTATGGESMIASAGVTETPAKITDSSGNMRAYTSVLGSMNTNVEGQ